MLAVMLTISVILAAILFGSLIPQGLPPAFYLEHYGEGLSRPFLALGLDDIFRTKGFAFLGVILLVQLFLCTGRRISLLRRDMKLWAAGSVLLHLGLLVFLVSTGVSLWWGRVVPLEAPEGKVLSPAAQGVPFDLRLERFEIDYYPVTRAVRQYRSEVTLLREGTEIMRGSLEVNEPLAFEGAKIFQMTYGWLLEGSVRFLPDGKAESFSIKNGAWVNFPESGNRRLRGVLMVDPDNYWATKPAAAFLFLSESGERNSVPVVLGAASTAGNMEVRFDRLRRYSGLQIKQDPGIPGIFSGLALALTGLVLRYLPLRRRNSA